MKNLRDVCESLRATIQSDYDLGYGDAEELFGVIWSAMQGECSRIENAVEQARLTRAMNVVGEEFAI